MLSVALLALVLAQPQGVALEERPKVPPFVPRSASLGVLLQRGVISPMVRVGWEIDLIDQPRNRLIFIAEVGAALSVATPTGLKFLHQESLSFGLGYRFNRGPIHWGLHAGAGPVFYGAVFERAAVNISNVWLQIEGRVQLGINVGPVALAGFFGIGTLPSFDDRSAGAPYLGGFLVGLLVNWR